jgi:hypothetical protein
MAKLTPREIFLMAFAVFLALMLLVLREDRKGAPETISDVVAETPAQNILAIQDAKAKLANEEFLKGSFTINNPLIEERTLDKIPTKELKQRLGTKKQEEEFNLTPPPETLIEMKEKGIQSY